MLKVHIFPFQTEQLASAVAAVNSQLKEHSELNGNVLAVEQLKDMSDFVNGVDFLFLDLAFRNSYSPARIIREHIHLDSIAEYIGYNQREESIEGQLRECKGDVEFAAANKLGEDEFRIEIGGAVFTERKTAGEVLQKAAIKAMATADGKDHIPIGKFCGFELAIEKIHNGFMVGVMLYVRFRSRFVANR